MFLKWSSGVHMNFVQCRNGLVAMATIMLNLLKKYSKIFSSEAIRGIKLKRSRSVHNISFYKYFVFCCHCSCDLVAMATLSFHRLTLGKVKVGLFSISLQIF